MVKDGLKAGILGVKVAYLEITEDYFKNLMIGDNASIKKQQEILRALYIYIQVLDYYGLSDGKSTLEEKDIDFILGESMRLINIFKKSYYV